jgi:hypothetical protein
MIEEGIVAYLTTYPALVALQSTRLYPVTLPQSPTLPCMKFQRVSGPLEYTHSGQSAWAEARFQFDCWGDTPLIAKQLAQSLKSALSGFKGTLGMIDIYAAFIENDVDDFDEETGVFRQIVDVMFEYKEAG